ncbi:MAG: bifunctional RNase H/acid phosphatase [Mycobacteriales bacterium]
MRRLLVEADGGSRGNPGPAGYGAVVKDAVTGTVLAERAESIGVASNNVAEYQGLIAGLAAARDMGEPADLDIEVRMDSKLVVEQMSGRWQIKHADMQRLAKQARQLATGLGRVRYTWVPRERNQHADRLANEAMDASAKGEEEAASDAVVARSLGWGGDHGTPTRLYLVRHGATQWSAERRYAGATDLPLTADGERQAALLADGLAGVGAAAVVSSPLERATGTAGPIAAKLGVEVEVDAGLAETDFGSWEGLTFAEIQERTPADAQAWLASPEVPPPGGEPLTAVARRVRQARDRLISSHPGETVVVVSHVTPIKLLVRLALDAPPTAVFRMQLDPGAVTVIDWYIDGRGVLRTFNDTGYLRG